MKSWAPLFALCAATSLLPLACSAATPSVPPEAAPPPAPQPSATAPTVLIPPAASTPEAISHAAPRCSASCKGTITPELVTQLRDRSTKARACYLRLLRTWLTSEHPRGTAEPTGKIMLAVQMEPEGLCQLSMESVDPGLEPLEPCIRQLFEEQSFAAPQGGCVNVKIPLVFSIKDAPDAAP